MFNKAPKNNKQKMFKFNLYWMYGLIFIMLFALYLTNDSSASKELGWTEFQKLAQENVFDRMVVYNKKNLVEATVKDGRKGLVFRKDSATLGTNPKVYVKIPSADKFSDFYDKSVAENHITTQVSFEEGDDAIWNFLVSFGPILLIIVVWIFLMRRMSGGASGGLSTPLILPTRTCPPTRTAPELPADTKASASPFFTIFIATTMDESFLPRIAFTGGSAVSITSVAFTISICSSGYV